MRLEKLQLINFKNHKELNLEFSPRINVLAGKNGSGKTNLLDAIYYLSLTKSAFASGDNPCVCQDESFFMVKGIFELANKSHEITASFKTGGKKIFREDQFDYPKLSEHIGKYPVVLMAPDDVDLVKEGAEARRKFFDSIISQIERKYLEDLIQYNYGLKQRNSLLKMFQEKGVVDELALETYDRILVEYGKPVFERRSLFIKEFIPVFQKFYRFIADADENTDLAYISELSGSGFSQGLKRNRQRDILLQRTNFGIHKDDFDFKLNGNDLKRFGSQGQKKSFVIALKLAQFEILEKYKAFKPILLLDDIFDKLDDFRIARLLELIKTNFGQLFITDARPERTEGLLKSVHVPASFFRLNEGTVNQEVLRDAG